MISDSDFDQLIQFIQSSLASPDTIDEDMLRDEAVAFNELCYEVNAKLSSIERLINRGLRDDALVAAGRDGELLTLFEKLDFPDRDLWTELVQAFGLPKPPELNHDAAAKLNMAYATLGDIEGLMNNHRLFALAHAPLSARIRILNALAIKDPDNPLWQTDLATFQLARLSQIPSEVERAVREENLEGLRAISDELSTSKWWVNIPPKLTAQVKTALTANHKRDLIDQIKSESIRIQSAFAEFDIKTGFSAADKIQKLGAEANLMSDDPLVLEMEPALRWVQEQREAIATEDREQKLIDNLELALEKSTARIAVERAYSNSKMLGDRLPQALRQRAIERIASFDMMARRRTTLIYGSAAVVLAIIGSLTGLWIVQSRQENAGKELEAALTALIDSKEWEQANSLLQSQSSNIQSRPVVQVASKKITIAIDEEKNRIADFAQTLAQLEKDETTKPNYDLLNRLRSLVRTGDEKIELLKHESIAEKRRLVTSELDSRANRIRFEALTKRVDEVLSEYSSNPNQQISLNAVQAEVAAFVESVSKSNPELASSAKMMDRRLQNTAADMKRAVRRNADLDRITNAVGDVDNFRTDVRNYAGSSSDDSMADDLKKIDERVNEIQKQNAWNELLEHPTFNNLRSITAEAASEWLRKYEAALAEHPNHCLQEFARKKQPFIEKASKIQEAIQNLTSLSRLKLLGSLWIYTDGLGTYYSPNAPNETRKIDYMIEYVADFSMTKLQKNFGSTYKSGVLPNVKKAGQSEFGEQFRDILKSTSDENFTPQAYKILFALKQIPEDKMDPVFKLYLLRTLFDAILPASQPLADGFGTLRDEMTDDSFAWDTNWLSNDPKDMDVGTARQEASKLLLVQLASWDVRKNRMAESYKKMITNDAISLKWVGWVAKKDQKWVALVSKPTPDVDLAVIRHFGATSKLIPLGKCQGASVTVSEGDAQLAGLPVYAIIKNK